MNYRPILRLLLCAISAASLLSGCQSSKIAYGNSYYFKQTPKSIDSPPASVAKDAISKIEHAPAASELLTTDMKETATVKDIEQLIEQAQQQTLAMAEKSNNVALKEKAHRINNLLHTAISEDNSSKKEVRAKRKEFRKEMRSLIKEYKASPKSIEAEQQMDQKLRLSLILGAGGLLLFILGAAVAGPVGGIFALLGLLALIGGLVMLIIWGVEQ